MTENLSAGGLAFLIVTWLSIIFLSVFCLVRILNKKNRQQSVAPGGGGRVLWGSRLGLIMAMAGNAVGLGNFLRFPVKAAGNGGGTFLIPYFLAFILLGLPVLWVEWAMGRYGGNRGHGTTPGMLDLMWRNPVSKFLGVLGIVIPFTIAAYYTVIESWTLAFAWFSASGQFSGDISYDAMGSFLRGFQGVESNQFFSSLAPAALFLSITVLLNYLILRKGLTGGIERLSKYGMPALFIMALVLAIRVLTLGTPNSTRPDWNIGSGLAFLWNPDFSQLGDAGIWLAAAGQIFFTIGIGQGIINCYASFLRPKEDIVLNGLTAASVNELVEVILGGTITIPVAVAFFGIAGTEAIAAGGSFNLGFEAMPVIFQAIAFGRVFGTLWFLLLFIAGITSSVALATPVITFFEDEFGWKRKKAVNITFTALLLATLPVFFFLKQGFMDELDFWAGTLGLVVFATIEILIFSWIFGLDKGWIEINSGADIRLPRFFRFIIKYVTPVYLLIMLGAWLYQDAFARLQMSGVNLDDRPYLYFARSLLIFLGLSNIWLIKIAWDKKKKTGRRRSPKRA